MPLKRNGIRTKFLKDAFNNLFKTNLPKNKIQPTNDPDTLQTQQATNGITPKKRNSSSSQRSSKGSRQSLKDMIISFPNSQSSRSVSGTKSSVSQSAASGTKSQSSRSVSGTKSSASPSAASGTKSSASSRVEAKTKSATSAPSIQTKKPTSTRTKSATSAPAALSGQTKRPSSTAKIGLENMGALPIDIILNKMFKKDLSSILDFDYLKKIKKTSMIFAPSLNPLLKKLELPQIETYLLPNIITINLAHDVINLAHDVIDEFTLNILNLTVKYSKVSTIILRNITFENDDIGDKFLEYLQKNTRIERLILRKISMDNYLNRLVDIIGKLTNITLLEFSNFCVNYNFHINFLRTLIKLQNLKHLIFNNNNISSNSYAYIFSGYYQFLLPYSGDVFKGDVFKDVGVYFIDNYVIKTNFYDNSNKQYNHDKRMTIYSNLENLEYLENLENLDDPAKFKQMNSLNFHAYGNYYLLNKHEQFFLKNNVSKRNLYDYTSASIQDIMNKLESELGVHNLSLQMK